MLLEKEILLRYVSQEILISQSLRLKTISNLRPQVWRLKDLLNWAVNEPTEGDTTSHFVSVANTNNLKKAVIEETLSEQVRLN